MTRRSPGGAPTPSGGKVPQEPKTYEEALRQLSPQRRRFITSYLERPNATRAAKAAGYSPSTARSQGQRLLTFVDIRRALRLGEDEHAMGAGEVKSRTAEVARGTLEDFWTFETVEHRPRLQRPVSKLLEELFQEIDFEERFAKRAGLIGKALKQHQGAQADRKLAALRMEMEMEVNPKATRWVYGAPTAREVERLDLAKARDLGVLHLLKSVKYTPHGPTIELKSAEHARDVLGRLHGLWTKDDDDAGGSGGLPPSTGLEDATDADLQAQAMRLLGADL